MDGMTLSLRDGRLYCSAEEAPDAGGAPGAVAAPPADTSPAPAPVVADPSTGTEFPSGEPYPALDWRSLPDLATLRDEVDINNVLQVYPNMANFIKDAVGWRSEMSRRVRLPNGEHATSEDWQKYWQQLPGYPKSPQGYTDAVQLPELGQDDDGQAVTWDTEMLTSYYEMAHAKGFTAEQVQSGLEVYAQLESRRTNINGALDAQALVDAERQLQERFGASLPRKIGAARNYFMRSLGNTDLGDTLWEKVRKYRDPETGVTLGNDPDFIDFYSMQYERFGEPMDLLSDNLFPTTPTLGEIDAEKAKALTDSNDTSKSTQERQAAFERLQRLNEQQTQLKNGRR